MATRDGDIRKKVLLMEWVRDGESLGMMWIAKLPNDDLFMARRSDVPGEAEAQEMFEEACQRVVN